MRKIVRILLPVLFSLLLAMPAGAVPVADNQEIQTYRGVSVGGQLCAATPDGGGVSYTLTTYPCKGSVELQEDGSFVYTPQENRRGRDYFGYRAVDAEGNVSQEAVVIIRLLRRRQSERYEDTAGLGCDYAAHALADLVSDEELSADYILPAAFDKRVGPAVAKAVAEAARKSGVARI